jgi:hypothetical protein
MNQKLYKKILGKRIGTKILCKLVYPKKPIKYIRRPKHMSSLGLNFEYEDQKDQKTNLTNNH